MGFSVRLFYLTLVFTIFFAGLLIASETPPYSRQTVVVEQIKAPSVY